MHISATTSPTSPSCIRRLDRHRTRTRRPARTHLRSISSWHTSATLHHRTQTSLAVRRGWARSRGPSGTRCSCTLCGGLRRRNSDGRRSRACSPRSHGTPRPPQAAACTHAPGCGSIRRRRTCRESALETTWDRRAAQHSNAEFLGLPVPLQNSFRGFRVQLDRSLSEFRSIRWMLAGVRHRR